MPWKKICVNLDLLLAGVILTILIVVAAATVFSRYVVARPFMWSEEVQVICFMWITFLGAGAAFRYGAHVSIEMVVDLLPAGIRRWTELAINALVALLLAYLLWLSVIYLGQLHMLKKTTTILKIPEYLTHLAVPLGFASMLAGHVATAWAGFRAAVPDKTAAVGGR